MCFPVTDSFYLKLDHSKNKQKLIQQQQFLKNHTVHNKWFQLLLIFLINYHFNKYTIWDKHFSVHSLPRRFDFVVLFG